MPGPPPKPPDQRRNRRHIPGQLVFNSGELVPEDQRPALGPRPDGAPWHPAALAHWAAIWESPMAHGFETSDIHGLVRLMDLIHLYWSLNSRIDGDLMDKALEVTRTKLQIAAEIRREQQNFGLSPLDRSRLKWEIERGEAAGESAARRRTPARKGRKAADPRGTE